MARRKLSRIKEYDQAKTRLAALKSIDPALDLGNGMTVPNYEKTINDFTTLLGQYNTALSTVDDFYNQCIDSLKGITDMSERMLSGVGFKYTKNSSEYEMAGGTRKSERRKPTPKKPAA
jgi:hypothetical protein